MYKIKKQSRYQLPIFLRQATPHPATACGHNWRITVYCQASALNENGMVEDFSKVKHLISDKLDHQNLNEVLPAQSDGREYARWIWMSKFFLLPGGRKRIGKQRGFLWRKINRDFLLTSRKVSIRAPLPYLSASRDAIWPATSATPCTNRADMTDEEIVNEVTKYPSRHLILTGGETFALHRPQFCTAVQESWILCADWDQWYQASSRQHRLGDFQPQKTGLTHADELKIVFQTGVDLEDWNQFDTSHRYLQPCSMHNERDRQVHSGTSAMASEPANAQNDWHSINQLSPAVDAVCCNGWTVSPKNIITMKKILIFLLLALTAQVGVRIWRRGHWQRR